MAIQGSLESISIPELFSLIHQLRRTGTLSVVNDADERGFLFYHGNLVYATSKDASRRLGHFLVRLGFLAPEEVEEEFSTPPGSELYRGQALVERGRVSRKQLHSAVMAQILDIMKEVMSWTGGAFHFDDHELPFHIPGETLIRTQSVLLEASRQHDEDGYAQSLFPEKNAILAREDWTPPEDLSEEHARVLELVDGSRTVEQIIFAGPGGRSATASALRDLVNWGAVRRTGVAVSDTSPVAPELVNLPVAPDIPVRLFAAFSSVEPQEQIRAVGELLREEPVLTAKVLKTLTLRNVELRRSQLSIEDLVELLGLFHLRSTLLPEATRALFLGKDLCAWRLWWDYSRIAAHFAESIAVAIGYLFPGEAYLAGLLHELGAFLLLNKDPEAYRRVVNESLDESRDLAALEEETFGISHSKLGAVYAEKWRFPRMLQLAIKHHHYTLDAPPSNPLLHIVAVVSGFLESKGYQLGHDPAMPARVSYALKALELERGRAETLYQDALWRASRRRSVSPVPLV